MIEEEDPKAEVEVCSSVSLVDGTILESDKEIMTMEKLIDIKDTLANERWVSYFFLISGDFVVVPRERINFIRTSIKYIK